MSICGGPLTSTLMNFAPLGIDFGFFLGSAFRALMSSAVESWPSELVSNCAKVVLPHLCTWFRAASTLSRLSISAVNSASGAPAVTCSNGRWHCHVLQPDTGGFRQCDGLRGKPTFSIPTSHSSSERFPSPLPELSGESRK